ncbi:HutD/Ves family protein [Brumimicrobium oceani]|uniref:HutD-family protein n=1 Tax=Brumimicrobium oceani TaxID=2100725 RepID=A0A2U2XEI6_9FLAO|nr:HutD family protein [Brumimicrobium oceani]PWH86183.1 hypothetical protein DIT68_06405 [Brumimicrobium oceani]
MKTHILTPQNFQTSQWSGGTTTQLYISPEGATLANRDFKLRISIAKVETSESSFTSLPGVNRKLMILEGEITITHEGHYSKHLKPFDVDTFKGDWKTNSKGTCTDFNVMTTGEQQNEMYYLAMGAAMNYKLKPKSTCKDLFIYATSGNCTLRMLGENHFFHKGDLMVIEDFTIPSISISSPKAFGIVVLEV